MGYNTQFSFKVVENNSNLPDDYIIYSLRKVCDDAAYALDGDGKTEEVSKWYEYKPDIKKFSIEFPDVTMCLSGEGEENDDIWKMYFRNGKTQYLKAVFTMPKFSEDNWE